MSQQPMFLLLGKNDIQGDVLINIAAVERIERAFRGCVTIYFRGEAHHLAVAEDWDYVVDMLNAWTLPNPDLADQLPQREGGKLPEE